MPTSSDQHRKNLIKLIQQNSYRHPTWQVFADFCEMSAIAISNSVDLAHREEREKRYLEIVKRYSKDEVERFSMMLGELVMALDTEPSDVLGTVFHDLELHNTHRGQFFSPYHLCQAMAKMTLDPAHAQRFIEERGFVSAAEPACGSGAMVIALSEAMREHGINPQRCLHVTATDLDARCVHMAYLQLSLLHIPAIIQHGNTLTTEEFGRWYTPAHVLGLWSSRTRRSAKNALLTPAHDTPVVTSGQAADIPAEPPSPVISRPASVEPMRPRGKPQQLTLF